MAHVSGMCPGSGNKKRDHASLCAVAQSALSLGDLLRIVSHALKFINAENYCPFKNGLDFH
jgi:hypothetical protein